jgi:hypothetical protein
MTRSRIEEEQNISEQYNKKNWLLQRNIQGLLFDNVPTVSLRSSMEGQDRTEQHSAATD